MDERKKSLLVRLGNRYGVDPVKLLESLKSTAFRQRRGQLTNEQMLALLIVADQYNLNPYTNEITAFPDGDGIVPVVSVDGWVKIINSHPDFDGIEYSYSETLARPEGALSDCYEWIECTIHRRDRQKPTTVREFLNEVYRKPFATKDGKKIIGPWQTHPKRMLRHKATIQCARIAFGFVGIYDPDEASRIIEAKAEEQVSYGPVAEIPVLDDEKFEAYAGKWKDAVRMGRTPEQIMAMVETKYKLSDAQKQRFIELCSQEADEQDKGEA